MTALPSTRQWRQVEKITSVTYLMRWPRRRPLPRAHAPQVSLEVVFRGSARRSDTSCSWAQGFQNSDLSCSNDFLMFVLWLCLRLSESFVCMYIHSLHQNCIYTYSCHQGNILCFNQDSFLASFSPGDTTHLSNQTWEVVVANWICYTPLKPSVDYKCDFNTGQKRLAYDPLDLFKRIK